MLNLRREIALLRQEVHSLQEKLDEVVERPAERIVELSTLYVDGFSLTRPILVNIEEHADETIARWPAVGATAFGISEGDALENLGAALVELWQDLRDTAPEELGTLPHAWLAVLNNVITRAKA